jgi:peptidoglycan/xylan/chitin deacetylase (PgdA/CDA1 family)
MLLSLIGVSAAALASAAGYHTMGPTSQLYGRNFTGLTRGTRQLALTYDDGPNDPHTGHLLDVLAKHNVRATFFLIGRYVAQRPDLVRRHVEFGNALGNHTWDHPNLIFSTSRSLQEQLAKTSEAIKDACGAAPRLFRPPFGVRRPGVFQTARALGMTPIMWNVTCYDWSAKSNETIERHAQRQINGGNVILLHDGGHLGFGADRSWTVKATDNLIRKYKDEGYEFVTVPEMMKPESQPEARAI